MKDERAYFFPGCKEEIPSYGKDDSIIRNPFSGFRLLPRIIIFDASRQRYIEVVCIISNMASEITTERPTAAESLVKAFVTVLDNVNVQAHFDKASIETAARLGAHSITYIS